MNFSKGFYIKLGSGGQWAVDCISTGIMRFGWSAIPLDEIRTGKWDRIRDRLECEHRNRATVTADMERLRNIATSTSEDVWITFHQSKLWWGRVSDSPVDEDGISKFRRMRKGWFDCDVTGHKLIANQIPGRIAQLQGFRGTVCAVHELDTLGRLLSATPSDFARALSDRRAELVSAAVPAIRSLHWKEFETLVDLIFRQAGWRRRSVLGETMKFADLELEEPITRDAYQVQIKSRADVSEFESYVAQFSDDGFRRLYFVVHSPSPALAQMSPPPGVELILPARLAQMVVDHGLLGWLVERVR